MTSHDPLEKIQERGKLRENKLHSYKSFLVSVYLRFKASKCGTDVVSTFCSKLVRIFRSSLTAVPLAWLVHKKHERQHDCNSTVASSVRSIDAC